jgi:hypothetical protein
MGDAAQTAEGKFDLRSAMPLTAAWVDQQRGRFGKDHVNDCIRRALRGERNLFYAVEAGHVLGTPFDWSERGLFIVSMSVLTGARFVAGLLDPAGVVQLEVPEAPNGQNRVG